jgi:spore coat polysaccharide biosynthesis protein SpsF
MKTVAIIQARMGSTRLPGKVMKEISGEPMLSRVVNRTRRARLLDDVMVATSTEVSDDTIEDYCRHISAPVFRGCELDVLDRYYRAAQFHGADVVVRITSDCPLIEPEIIDRSVTEFMEQCPDYASNGMVRTFPRGLDVEVMSLAALERAWSEATEGYQRVHVTPYLYQSSHFRLLNIVNDVDYSCHRWTVDTALDLDFVRAVYRRLGPADTFNWREVIRLVEEEPALAEINRSVAQKALHEA